MPAIRVPHRCLAIAIALSGCYTGLGAAAGGGDDEGADSAAAEGGGASDSEGGAAGEARPDPAILDMHTAVGLRRLTRFEYGNTVRDLLGVEDAEADLPEDAKVDFLSNNAHAKQLGLAELETFARVAEDVATAAMTTIELPGCTADAPSTACLDAWLPTFLLRAFRRPPTEDDVARYRGLFDARVAAGDPPGEALRLVIQAVLLSPHFLYRDELAPDGSIAPGELDGYAVASRLSYLLWATMPDDTLLAAAGAGELDGAAGIAGQAERLLADPRAQIGVVRFVAEWLGTDQVQVVKKDPVVLADLPASLQQDLEQELQRFVVSAMLGSEPSLSTLLGSTSSFANATLASIYGLDGTFDAELRPVELDPSTRRGVLTMPLVLAAHTKESGFSVVQMGKFVRERLLCQTIPPPPPGVSTTLPDGADQQSLTYRERLEQLTSAAECAACHVRLNPPGFVYLPYDAIGRHSDVDLLGRPFDTTGVLAGVDGVDRSFSSPTEVFDILVDAPEVRACFTRRYVEYAFGRTLAPEDVELYHVLADDFDASGGDFPGFVAALVAAPEFGRTGPFAP